MSNPLLQTTVPVGTIIAFALNAPIPAGWLLCDGMPVNKALFPSLGMFMSNTPNLCGRTLIGAGPVPGSNYMPGQTGGEETHILTEVEMPEHSHNLDLPQGDQEWSNGSGNTTWGNGSGLLYKSAPAGSNAPHNNMQPYYVVNYIIYAGY